MQKAAYHLERYFCRQRNRAWIFRSLIQGRASALQRFLHIQEQRETPRQSRLPREDITIMRTMGLVPM